MNVPRKDVTPVWTRSSLSNLEAKLLKAAEFLDAALGFDEERATLFVVFRRFYGEFLTANPLQARTLKTIYAATVGKWGQCEET